MDFLEFFIKCVAFAVGFAGYVACFIGGIMVCLSWLIGLDESNSVGDWLVGTLVIAVVGAIVFFVGTVCLYFSGNVLY